MSGDTVSYPDGTVFVAVEPGQYSLSQCTSGRFCIWTQASYAGSITYKSGDGATYSITGTVGSFWNNRTKAARLYNNAGTGYACYAAAAKLASVGASYNAADSVYLSTTTAC